MERELKKIPVSIIMMEDKPRITIQAYTTSVAGLVVHSLHQITRKNGKDRIVKRQCNWCVTTYPVGLRVLAGFTEKQQAIDFCETHLAKYSWVALLREDILKNNDMNVMREDFIQYRKMIAELKR